MSESIFEKPTCIHLNVHICDPYIEYIHRILVVWGKTVPMGADNLAAGGCAIKGVSANEFASGIEKNCSNCATTLTRLSFGKR